MQEIAMQAKPAVGTLLTSYHLDNVEWGETYPIVDQIVGALKIAGYADASDMPPGVLLADVVLDQLGRPVGLRRIGSGDQVAVQATCIVLIYSLDGEGPSTPNMEMSDAASHVAAGDRLSIEAAVLLEFHKAEEVPPTMVVNGETWYRIDEGTDRVGPYTRYACLT
jgi:hypothetical protein